MWSKLTGPWTALVGLTGLTNPLPTPQTRNTLLAPKWEPPLWNRLRDPQSFIQKSCLRPFSKITCDPITKLLSQYLSIYSTVVCGTSFFTSVRQWIKLLAWGDLGGSWLFIILSSPTYWGMLSPKAKKKPQLLTRSVLTAFFHIPSWELHSIGMRMMSILLEL